MAKETRSEISFHEAANVARRVEMVLAQGGQGSDKRPHYSGGFSDASSGGRGTFGRGHPPMPFHSALQASHSASGSRGPYVPHSGQPAYSAPSNPISAPSIQSYYSGHTARSGQSQFPLPQYQDGCYECGGYGHIRRTCPRLLGVPPQHQGSRAMVPTTVAAPYAHPSNGRGQAARGRGQTVRGEGQAIRGESQSARGRLRDVV
ncbi:uncharacterized protein [Nicotiana tomentosiformis]|uniref:uncharacterized protein n=1 Tax=Nicotiana tomentosiformis TaxID=4098 RepID=UPI00388CC0B3